MNSFRFLERGIEAEIERQRKLLDAGEQVEQETFHYHPEDGSLTPLRSKEYARLPLLPSRTSSPSPRPRRWSRRRGRRCPELPAARRERYVSEVGLGEEAAATLAFDTAYAEYFERALAAADRASAKAIANWVTGELVAALQERRPPWIEGDAGVRGRPRRPGRGQDDIPRLGQAGAREAGRGGRGPGADPAERGAGADL